MHWVYYQVMKYTPDASVPWSWRVSVGDLQPVAANEEALWTWIRKEPTDPRYPPMSAWEADNGPWPADQHWNWPP